MGKKETAEPQPLPRQLPVGFVVCVWLRKRTIHRRYFRYIRWFCCPMSLGTLSYKYVFILSMMSSSLVCTVCSVFVTATSFQHFRGEEKRGRENQNSSRKPQKKEKNPRRKYLFPPQEIRKWFKESCGKFMCLRSQRISVFC